MLKILHIPFLASLLLIPLLYNIFGYYAVYESMQFAVKKEVKRKIRHSVPVEELSLLKITKKTETDINVFQRIHEREFRYHGEMYDIVSQEIHGDTTYYFCVHDKAETKLFANLELHINKHISENAAHRHKNKKLIQKIAAEYLMPKAVILSAANIYTDSQVIETGSLLQNGYLSIISPPPQFS